MKKYTTPSVSLNMISTEEIMFLTVSNNTNPSLYADWNDMFSAQGASDPGMDF